MNRKLSSLDKLSIIIKRHCLGWKIKALAKHYKVSKRTIYRSLDLW